MVKGVNKTVIEINDTGSNIFEKAILFVTPKYSNLSAKRLKTEAKRVVNNYYSSADNVPTVRQKYKRRRVAVLFGSFLLLALITVGILMFCK